MRFRGFLFVSCIPRSCSSYFPPFCSPSAFCLLTLSPSSPSLLLSPPSLLTFYPFLMPSSLYLSLPPFRPLLSCFPFSQLPFIPSSFPPFLLPSPLQKSHFSKTYLLLVHNAHCTQWFHLLLLLVDSMSLRWSDCLTLCHGYWWVGRSELFLFG